MIDDERKKEAQQNFTQYLQDGLIKKEKNETAKAMYSKSLLEEYEMAKDDALEIASIKSDEIIELYGLEMGKRSRFQYEMTESIQEQKANTSLKRARQFILEMKKLLILSKK